MVVLTAETCWALNEYWIYNKISGIKLVSFYSTVDQDTLLERRTSGENGSVQRKPLPLVHISLHKSHVHCPAWSKYYIKTVRLRLSWEPPRPRRRSFSWTAPVTGWGWLTLRGLIQLFSEGSQPSWQKVGVCIEYWDITGVTSEGLEVRLNKGSKVKRITSWSGSLWKGYIYSKST